MKRLPVWCAILTAAAAGADSDTDVLLRSIESRYNHSQSLRLEFSETYAGKGHPVQTESGTLYLRKPGRMRWEYSAPAGKIFLSDGKDVYLYTPEDHKAEKSKLKESDDLRAPLAFLLGKLDFAKEFRSFELRREGPDTWITAVPKSANLAYNKVEFQAVSSGEIRQVFVTGQDGSRLRFSFSNEQLNAAIEPGKFTFRAPPGVRVIEAEQ